MSTHDEEAADFVLMSEALDALDRLYDEKSKPLDVAAILRMAGTAVSDRALGEQMLRASEQVRQAIRAALPAELAASRAAIYTEIVRPSLASAWADLSLRHEEG